MLDRHDPIVYSKLNPLPDEVIVYVNKKAYDGWEDVQLTLELNSLANDFQLQVTDKWREDQVPWGIQPQDVIHVHIGKHSMITGYVDKVEASVDKDNRSFTVSGRSKTCDLVDCSAQDTTYSGLTVDEAIRKMAQPFGIGVIALADVGSALDSIKIQTGETFFTAIDRIIKQKKLLVYSDGNGNVVLSKVGTRRSSTELKQGVNVLSGKASYDYTERFSEYQTKGQNDLFLAELKQGAAPTGKATDAAVKRFRPTVINNETNTDDASGEDRAAYEASIRAAKSIQVEVEVQGWIRADGTPWAINELVNCDLGFLGTRRQMLVKKVSYSKSAKTTCNLTLIRPDALDFSAKKGAKKEDELGWLKVKK